MRYNLNRQASEGVVCDCFPRESVGIESPLQYSTKENGGVGAMEGKTSKMGRSGDRIERYTMEGLESSRKEC